MEACANRATKGTVLLLEDDEHLREALRYTLEERGFDVEAYGDAIDALLGLRCERLPDLIVLDLRLPGMDGWEFRLVQKGAPPWAEVPVLAISGDHSAKAAAIDADAFLPKPICHVALLETVERLLYLSQRRKSAKQEAALERFQNIGSAAGAIAEHAGNPILGLLDNLKLAREKTAEMEGRLGGADALHVAGIRQLLLGAERSAELTLSVFQGVSMFAEMATQVARIRRRVLLVHRDPSVGERLRQAISEVGEVVSAALAEGNPLQALHGHDGFDVIFVEFSLLGGRGMEAFDGLARHKPEQARRIVFLTVGPLSQAERAFFERHRPMQLRSPFTTADLCDIVEAPWRGLH